MKLIDRILGWNPLAGRYAFAQLRPLNVGVSVFVYMCAVVMIVLLNFLGHRGSHRPIEKLVQDLFASIVALQILMLWVIGLYTSGSIVREAMLDKSIDFLRLLPISPHSRIAGMLVGRNLMLLVLSIINGLIALALGLAGCVPLTTLLDVGALIVVGATALMLLAVLVSGAEAHRRTQSGPVALFALCIFVLPFLFMMAANWEDFFPQDVHARFFGCKFRLIPLIASVILYVGIWIYAGLVRRFSHERAPLFTPRTSIGFMAGWIVLAVGLFWSVLSPNDPGIYLGLWMVLLAPLLLLPVGTARRYEDLVESLATGGEVPRLFPLRGNLRPGIICVGMWAAVALWLRPVGHDIPLVVGGLTTFWLVAVLLYEGNVVYAPLSPRIQHLSLVIAILYIGLPPVLSGVFRIESILWFSPAGYLALLVDSARYVPVGQGSVSVPTAVLVGVPVVNGVILVLLGRLILWRYRVLALEGRAPREVADAG